MYFILISQIRICFKISYFNIGTKYPSLWIVMKKQNSCSINSSILHEIQVIEQLFFVQINILLIHPSTADGLLFENIKAVISKIICRNLIDWHTIPCNPCFFQ